MYMFQYYLHLQVTNENISQAILARNVCIWMTGFGRAFGSFQSCQILHNVTSCFDLYAIMCNSMKSPMYQNTVHHDSSYKLKTLNVYLLDNGNNAQSNLANIHSV